MTTESTPATGLERLVDDHAALEPVAVAERRVAVVPGTGEAVDLDAPAPDLVGALDRLTDLLGDVRECYGVVERELIRRADATGKRTTELAPGLKVQVNAPTAPVFDVDTLRAKLGPLVRAGTVDRETYDALIVQPPRPPLPSVKVDGNVARGLLTSSNEELRDALEAARELKPVGRKLTIKSRPAEGTAEEVDHA